MAKRADIGGIHNWGKLRGKQSFNLGRTEAGGLRGQSQEWLGVCVGPQLMTS